MAEFPFVFQKEGANDKELIMQNTSNEQVRKTVIYETEGDNAKLSKATPLNSAGSFTISSSDLEQWLHEVFKSPSPMCSSFRGVYGLDCI